MSVLLGLSPLTPPHRRHVYTERLFVLAVLALMLVPPLLLIGIPPSLRHALYIGVREHSLVEGFCGVVALLIAGLILSVANPRRQRSFLIFGAAFLSMGLLDVLHAATDPQHAGHFVLFHTLSTLSSGALIFVGVLTHYRFNPDARPTRRDLPQIAVGVSLIASIIYLGDQFMPYYAGSNRAYAFSRVSRLTHEVAGVLYGLSAIAFYLYYRSHKQFTALMIAGLLLLFAESAYLFRFSTMWDPAWWLWHGVKVVFYVSVLATVFGGLVYALKTLGASQRVLARSNARLKRAHDALTQVNRELLIRNAMTKEAVASLDLDHTLGVLFRAVARAVPAPVECALTIKLAADELDEFHRRLGDHGFEGRLRAVADNALADHAHIGDGAVACFPLRASGSEFGHLCLTVPQGGRRALDLDKLGHLVAEMGPIVYNAFLSHQWAEGNRFQQALLRVSSLLTSTLDLRRVLDAVCSESARLMDSDGAAVWLYDDNEGVLIAGQCLSDGADANPAALAWQRALASSHFVQILTHAKAPLAISSDDRPLPFAIDARCRWGALAIFPLIDGERLIGAMMLKRSEQVRYSAKTLSKGELLAEQVRIAINNARSYKAMSEMNAQLRTAEEGKLRAERLAALGQMAASVAHEVRNPLTAIFNCLAVLRAAHGRDGKGDAALTIIADEVRRLDRLTRNFLTFGLRDARRQVPMHLDRIVEDTLALMERHVAQEALDVRLSHRVEGGAHVFTFDADALKEVLWNLLINAVQAIETRGEVRVHARLHARRLALSVEDNGRGIAPAEREKIFEPFYSRRSQGAGLGLAIVRRFVHDWGGRIRVTSRPGGGARFVVRIPLSAVDVAPDQQDIANHVSTAVGG